MNITLNDHAPCGIYCKRCPGIKVYCCKGCRDQHGKVKNFPVCKTYECAINKGYEFCFECDDFPCEKLQPIVNFEIFLPHNSKLYNLIMIKKVGIDHWNDICEKQSDLYYYGRKIQFGGDPLTLEKKNPDMYKKKKD
jgi:hypothetical protein